MAETKAILWHEAHTSLTQQTTQAKDVELSTLPQIPGQWYFTYRSWKAQDNSSGQGWYNTLEGFDGLMGANNTRESAYHSFMPKQK